MCIRDSLKGTPFEKLPVHARAANLKIKEIGTEFINNIATLEKLRSDTESIRSAITNRLLQRTGDSIKNAFSSINSSLTIQLFSLGFLIFLIVLIKSRLALSLIHT